MIKRLRKFLPTKVREWLEIQLEKWRLARLETLPADLGRLRTLSRNELREMLHSQELASAWSEASEQLAPFEIPDRTRGINPGDRRLVFQLVRSLAPRSVLEIGTHIGASTAHIALAQSRVTSVQGVDITTVDIVAVNDPVDQPWLRYGASKSPQQLLEALGVAEGVSFVHQNSLDFLERAEPESYDFVFLDGDHRAATVYREIIAALSLLRPGGVILLHDYYPNLRSLMAGDDLIAGPCLAVERLTSESALEVLPLGQLPWPTTLGSHATSMALLSRPA